MAAAMPTPIRPLTAADPRPSLTGPTAKPEAHTLSDTKGTYILHKCAHRQHVEVEALVFRNLRNMGSAKLDLRGGLLAALVENAGSAEDAEEDNGLYTACCAACQTSV
ncbi:hypothetical protein QJQ45_000848 [Haematococcus lacustris]|nr:hypothetical protein QJQ45_000848 [Haematococcus lacustris]